MFPEENLGQLGNAKRRVFYGPGINNFDLTLQKNVRVAESKYLEFRVEGFNAFNHAQFYGPTSVDGQVEDPNFGQIVSAATPRVGASFRREIQFTSMSRFSCCLEIFCRSLSDKASTGRRRARRMPDAAVITQLYPLVGHTTKACSGGFRYRPTISYAS